LVECIFVWIVYRGHAVQKMTKGHGACMQYGKGPETLMDALKVVV